MLKGSFCFFLCLVLFSAPAFILALDPILTGTGLYGLNHPRRNHPPVAEDQYVVAKAGKEKVIILRAKDAVSGHEKDTKSGIRGSCPSLGGSSGLAPQYAL